MNALSLEIAREIRSGGPMTFARFMELALYAPGLGYYERRRPIGREGDFYTSVSAGPLFGQLLAFQFARWVEANGDGERVRLVEAGAHDGALAADILEWLSRRRPDLLARLEYWLVEPSKTRRGWQEEQLRAWLPRVRWAADVADLGTGQVAGVIFSNEFLDALPVHRLAWSAKEGNWREWRVRLAGETFDWDLGPLAGELAGRLPTVAGELAAVLPDAFTIEICPQATDWWGKAGATLRRGKLVTIDYGLTLEERLRPERARGTLRAFARHHGGGDVLADAGEQDLTAHVDFTALEEAGRAMGLRTEGLVRQSKFLTGIVAQTEAQPGKFDQWTGKRVRQFQTLAHPEHLGEAFRVLIQGR
ncbi:MAG: SAM-dependent methyltransferase [Verrucomicrobiota bacterium]|jgi:SAM-dependent MidA family methyltransferase